MNINQKMDHFLSGLDSQSTPWYNHKAFQGHEFSVGLNSFQLIPISGSAVPQCSTEREIVSIGTAGMLPSSALISATNASLMAEVKQEMEIIEDRNENGEQPTVQPTKQLGKKTKGTKWDTRKACNICGKVLSRGDKLKNHIRIHTNNFPYHCDTCGHGFLRAEGLRVHTRIHTGERPFVCIVCGKSYTRKDKLTRHAIIHTGQRPFSCQHCGKSFTRKDKMQRHELIHKVEKPWTCVPCNVEFVRQEGFNAHMERKHPERLPYTLIPHQQRLLQKTLVGDYKEYTIGDRPTLVSLPDTLRQMQQDSRQSTSSGHQLDHVDLAGTVQEAQQNTRPSTSGHALNHHEISAVLRQTQQDSRPSTSSGHALDHLDLPGSLRQMQQDNRPTNASGLPMDHVVLPVTLRQSQEDSRPSTSSGHALHTMTKSITPQAKSFQPGSSTSPSSGLPP